MRVGFLVPGGLDRISGGFRYDWLLIAALRARGWTVDVVPLPWLPGLPALASNLLPVDAITGGEHDLVIQDELAHPSLLRANRRWRARGTPIVALVHNLGSRQPSARQRHARAILERVYLREVDGVAAVCASTRADVQALAGRPLPIVLAPAGRDHAPALDPAAARRRALRPGPLRVLFVAAVIPAKGLRLLGVLAALVAEGLDVTLDVAGTLEHGCAYVAAIRRQSNDAALAQRVRLHGLLRGGDLWRLFRRQPPAGASVRPRGLPPGGHRGAGGGLAGAGDRPGRSRRAGRRGRPTPSACRQTMRPRGSTSWRALLAIGKVWAPPAWRRGRASRRWEPGPTQHRRSPGCAPSC